MNTVKGTEGGGLKNQFSTSFASILFTSLDRIDNMFFRFKNA